MDWRNFKGRNRLQAGLWLGLSLLSAATGCKNTRPEVPPGRPYTPDGRQKPAVGFSTDPRPLTTDPNVGPGGIGRGAGLADRSEANPLGMPPGAGGTNYGIPANGSFGPAGTAGLADSPPPLTDPGATRTSTPGALAEPPALTPPPTSTPAPAMRTLPASNAPDGLRPGPIITSPPK